MAETLHFLRFRHMEDQGVILGTALCRKDSGNGVFIQAVGPQTVNRLRGNRHQLALADQRSSDRWRLIV